MGLRIAVCVLPSCLCRWGRLGLGHQPAYPGAENLGYMSCLVPRQQLSWTRVHDLWGLNL